YMKWVRPALQDLCDVYHAPWDTTANGAADTKYAIKCLHIFLTNNLLEQVFYDVIVFNFGLHDANYDFQWPEEYTDVKTYRENLMVIKDTLLATGSNVGYVMTTPVPFNVTANNRVKTFNMIARDVMSGSDSVEIADLYKRVLLVCGEPPYASCEIADKQPSPHYTKDGYRYLSVFVNHLVSNLLFKGSQHNIMMADHAVKASYHGIFQNTSLSCKNQKGQTVTKCPNTMTCSPGTYSATGWGCCPLPDAVSCTDSYHCCPAGYECDASCTSKLCVCNKL
ncbi:hypothetical protein QZH41_019516, partial [Actinostola sp. cb2023]